MGRKSEGFKLKKYGWSPFWYITGIPGKTQRISTNEESREAAEQRRAEFILELGKRRQQENKLTVTDCLNDYMNEHAQYLPSKETTAYCMRPIDAFFGDMLVEDIMPVKVKEFTAAQKKDGFKEGSIRRQLTILSAACNHAAKERRIEKAPFIPMPAQPAAKDRWLTKKEAAKLINSCKVYHVKMFIVLAIYTGQRKGAILDLQWSMVNLKNRRINFNPPGRVQTNKRRSDVPISNELYLYLQEAQKSKTKYVVSYKGKQVLDIKKGFAAACKAAGLKDVTPHTLRHTWGTLSAQAGVPIWEISGVLGHSNAKTTELYMKHSPEHLRSAVNKLQLANNSGKNQSKTAQTRKDKMRAV